MYLHTIIAFLLIGLFSVTSFADVSVDGYYRKDGTYVQPHHRSDPNSTSNDNWSTKGNTNPYTGQEGTHERNNNSWGN
jgi:hypothetical protein